MGRPATLLEGLCGHALSLGAQSIEVEYKDRREWVFAHKGGTGVGIANYPSSSADTKELRGNLYAAAKKPVRTVIGGQVCILKVRVFESFYDDCLQRQPGGIGRAKGNLMEATLARTPRTLTDGRELVKKADMRDHPRVSARSMVTVVWRDKNGQIRYMRSLVWNISGGGVLVMAYRSLPLERLFVSATETCFFLPVVGAFR